MSFLQVHSSPDAQKSLLLFLFSFSDFRLTPIYLFVILFFTYVSQLFGDGPFFRLKFPHAAQNCKDYWWTNILYVNNFYPKDNSKQVKILQFTKHSRGVNTFFENLLHFLVKRSFFCICTKLYHIFSLRINSGYVDCW